MDPLVVNAFEDSFATSEFLLCSAVAKITEVLIVLKEGPDVGNSINLITPWTYCCVHLILFFFHNF